MIAKPIMTHCHGPTTKKLFIKLILFSLGDKVKNYPLKTLKYVNFKQTTFTRYAILTNFTLVEEKGLKDKSFAERLLNKYRFVILNEDTFEERFAIKLTRLNVFILVSVSAIGLVFFTILFIAFTPLREYIPGYSSAELKKKATALTYKTDSIQRELELNEKYLASIRSVLTGEVQ